MPMSLRLRAGVVLLVLLIGAPSRADAQPTPYNLKYRSGQTVQPIYEGWSRNPDGGFTMHFGYFNRNFVEEVHVPVGPDNHFEPGDLDSGQPTFFYPRAHRRVFSIDVPGDFGDRRLVWNLTTQGETLRAIGWLEPTWQTEARSAAGRRLGAEAARNTAPEIGVEAPADVTLPGRATLIARVTDDGLPVVREIDPASRVAGSNDPPTLRPDPDEPEPPHNVPSVPNRRGAGLQGPRVRGLRVSWIVWRGPVGVSFEPGSTVAVEDGQAVVTATFATPGDYVLRATANDNLLATEHDVSITVR